MERATRGCYGYSEMRETLPHNLTPLRVSEVVQACTSGRKDEETKQENALNKRSVLYL